MEINWNPSIRQLRTFGLVSLVALPLAAAMRTHGSLVAIAWLALAGGVLAAVGFACPRGLRPILVAINIMTWPLVMIVRDVVLLAAFIVVIVPVGMLFRVIGRDALQLKIDRRATTYWQPKKQPAGVRSYFRRW